MSRLTQTVLGALLALAFLSSAGLVANAEEPALPAGLGSDEPALPAGLGSDEPALPAGLGSPEPSLPAGLGGSPSVEIEASDDGGSSLLEALGLTGFYEMRYGKRISSVGDFKDTSLGEARLQVEASWSGDLATINLGGDLVLDPVVDDKAIDLQKGRGWFDLREASIFLSPMEAVDLKLGRQVLTWGTGDLVFINDLFPKDWNALFIGRDDEYLKAPSDALKASFYVGSVTLDAVFTPQFDPDRFIDGRRLTFFNPMIGDIVTTSGDYPVIVPNEWGSDGEIALRVSGQAKSIEWAAYGYDGFWKSPSGFDPVSGANVFPELRVFGASLRGPLFGGIANGEIGYYDSHENGAASNPFIPNSQWRALAGFEREIITDLTGAAQVYVERLDNYDAYKAGLLPGMQPKDETRTLLTVRLTQMLMNQNLTLSLFNFYSTNEEDGYLRLKANYKLNDQWAIEGGGNIFYGAENASFFGQFEENSNVFVSLRMSF